LGKPRGNEKKEKEDIQDPHARAPASPSSSLPFSNEGNATTFDAAARFRFFRSQRRVLAWEITPHANEENARRNNGSVAYLLYEKKKRENEDAKPRAREDARPAEEGNANANAYLALFSTRREQTKERNHRVRDASMMCASSLNRE
jgi:acetyl-CoA acetyltransferase